MKKLMFISMLLLPAISHAGTITTSFANSAGSITISSNTAAASGQTYTYIQENACAAYTNTDACAFSGNVTAHSLLIISCFMDGGALGNTLVATSNNSNSVVSAGTTIIPGNGSGGQRAGLFYVLNANAGATTITCDDSAAGASAVQQGIIEYGTSAGGTFDVAASSSPGSAGGPGGAAVTTTVSNEFVVSCLNPGLAPSGQSGTVRINYSNDKQQTCQDQVAAVAGNVTPVFTASTSNVIAGWTAAFK
jgi:hypothetical protein